MSIKIFYHSADLDGHCSGALLKNRYPTAELFPINYGDRFPWDSIKSDDIVYMVDFSLDMGNMQTLSSRCYLIWIDHHVSAIKAYEKSLEPVPAGVIAEYGGIVIEGKREIGKAACELVWEWLYPDKPVPDAIKLLGLYDVWDHSHKLFTWDDYVEPFQYGLKTQETDPSKNWAFWAIFFYFTRAPIEDAAEYVLDKCKTGKSIREYIQMRYETELSTRSFKMDWEGHKCLVINSDPYIANYMTMSKAYEGCDLAVNFAWGGKFWIVNLRSNEVDCSELAKKYGGGGHHGAAGFQCEQLPVEFFRGG